MAKRPREVADPRYVYRKLLHREIRIAHLQPGQGDDYIVVEISHESVDGIEEFTALSWEWGSPVPPGEAPVVYVTDRPPKESTNGPTTNPRDPNIGLLAVRPNLMDALKQIRQKDCEIRLWIDAICINQIEPSDSSPEQHDAKEKNKEKSNQILMMTDIYGTAKEVWIWLGKECDNSSQAIKFIIRLTDLRDIDLIATLESNVQGHSNADDLIAFIKLMKRGWFSRRWIVQEISMAQRATIHCGTDSVEWTRFAAAVSLVEAVGRNGALNRILRRLPGPHNPLEYIGNTSSLPAYRLIQKASGELHGPDKRVRVRRFTIEELVSWMGAFTASRWHDTIFAVVGLASDVEPQLPKGWTISPAPTLAAEPPMGIQRLNTRLQSEDDIRYFEINYERPPLVVFKEFFDHVTQKSHSLDIMCRPWAPVKGNDATDKELRLDLPSWIVRLDRKPFVQNRHGNMVRCNPDPLVGAASFGRKWYSASGLERMRRTIHNINDPKMKRMTVDGFVLDTISTVYDCGIFGNVPGNWLNAGGWTDESETPPAALWRTLVAGRDAQGNAADYWYPLAFQSSVRERGIRYGFETERILDESSNPRLSELFRRVRDVVWNRRLIRTNGDYLRWHGVRPVSHPGANATTAADEDAERGLLGLAPNDARPGDLICILYGCSVPIVLRPLGPQKSSLAINGNGTNSPHGAWSRRHTWGGARAGIPARAAAGAPTTNGRGDNGTAAPASQSAPALPSGDSRSSDEDPENDDGEPQVYTVVGECYIDSMMDGEAIAYFKKATEPKPRQGGPSSPPPRGSTSFILE